MVPAHAGVVPGGRGPAGCRGGGPRARGGGPSVSRSFQVHLLWSPRTRGWSQGVRADLPEGRVVPAHAGVVPWSRAVKASWRRGPRARGGGPQISSEQADPFWWSPRRRGCSEPRRPVRRVRSVVPARAGVPWWRSPAGCGGRRLVLHDLRAHPQPVLGLVIAGRLFESVQLSGGQGIRAGDKGRAIQQAGATGIMPGPDREKCIATGRSPKHPAVLSGQRRTWLPSRKMIAAPSADAAGTKMSPASVRPTGNPLSRSSFRVAARSRMATA